MTTPFPMPAMTAGLPLAVTRVPRPTRGRSILQTIERLRIAAVDPIAGTLDRAIDLVSELAQLQAVIDGLRERAGNRIVAAPSQATVERAAEEWRRCRPDLASLSLRYIRALCAHPPAVNDPSFVGSLDATGELSRRRRWLESLVGVYEAEWRPIETAGQLERILPTAIRGFSGHSRRVDRLRPVASQVFSAEAAVWLANQAIEKRISVLDVLSGLESAVDTKLARAAADHSVMAWANALYTTRGTGAVDLAFLEYGLAALMAQRIVSPAAFARAAERVIEWVPEDRDRALARLRDWALDDQRLGDPRLPANQAKWATLSSEARNRMVRWLAKGDLLFFFDFVMDNIDDVHGRKEFWLQFIDQVEDSAVALSEEDARRLRLTVADQVRYARASGPGDNVSAFLMKFRGVRHAVVVEFSQPGNAAYVHDADLFNLHVGGLRARRYEIGTHRRGLKSRDTRITRYNHNGSWQQRVAWELRSLGILSPR